MSLLFWLWLGAYLVVGVVVAVGMYRGGIRFEVPLGLLSKRELALIGAIHVLFWLPLAIWFLWDCEVLPWIRARWRIR